MKFCSFILFLSGWTERVIYSVMFPFPAEGGDHSGASRYSHGTHSLHHRLLLLDQESKVGISVNVFRIETVNAHCVFPVNQFLSLAFA